MPATPATPDFAAAFARWIDALNAYGDAAATAAAVEPDVTVLRFGFFDQQGELVQTLRGTDAVQAWLALTRDVCRFAMLQETLQADGHAATVRYRITAPDPVAGEFVGGGLWRAWLGATGRIARLEHRPDELDPKYGEPMVATGVVVFGEAVVHGDNDDHGDHGGHAH